MSIFVYMQNCTSEMNKLRAFVQEPTTLKIKSVLRQPEGYILTVLYRLTSNLSTQYMLYHYCVFVIGVVYSHWVMSFIQLVLLAKRHMVLLLWCRALQSGEHRLMPQAQLQISQGQEQPQMREEKSWDVQKTGGLQENIIDVVLLILT